MRSFSPVAGMGWVRLSAFFLCVGGAEEGVGLSGGCGVCLAGMQEYKAGDALRWFVGCRFLRL